MFRTDYLDSAILEELTQVGTCTIEELYQRLPFYSLGQVFSVTDRLTQQGTVIIKNPAPSRYFLSLAPRRAFEVRPMSEVQFRASAPRNPIA